jgi:glycosyltransferase involved in cell wall biosynthesis
MITLKKILKIIAIRILKFAHHKRNVIVIFQNEEDKNIFINNKIINENQSYKIKGSGINLDVYRYTVEPNDVPIRILFTARMLRDKGVIELADAARLLKKRYYHKIKFLLAGDIDNNPKSLTRSELESIIDGEYIKWLGHRTDVRELLEQSHIFAFPSYYREGLPKSLIEACAVGRPIVTTDSIGCKDCVIDGYNGFLVPIRDSQTLAEKLELLINDKQLRIRMGINSRKMAERDFSIDNVVRMHLEIYNRLLVNNTVCAIFDKSFQEL